jgi:hypothetical protein
MGTGLILVELCLDSLVNYVGCGHTILVTEMTGRTLGLVYSSRSGRIHAMHLLSSGAIRPNLVLKTWPEQLLGSLPLNTTPRIDVSGLT